MPKYLSAKIDEAIIVRARVIAAHKGVSLSDYLSDTLDPCIDRDFSAMVEEMSKGSGGGRRGNGSSGGRPEGPGNHGPPESPRFLNPNPGPSEPPPGVVPHPSRRKSPMGDNGGGSPGGRPANRKGNAK